MENKKINELRPYFVYADEIASYKPIYCYYLKLYGCTRANKLYNELKDKCDVQNL